MEEENEFTGAIDTGEDYTPAPAQAAPQAAAPQSQGAISLPDVGEPAFGADEGRETPMQGMRRFGRDVSDSLGRSVENVKKSMPGRVTSRVVSYLMGADAGAPHLLQEAAAQVDPQGQMSPDDRNVAAVQKVAQDQGPEAAWKLVQANRVAYNAKQAFAYTALNGTPQKRPDLAAAVDAANQAASHVLDGSTARFAIGQGGITATVSSPGGQPQTINLTPDQFRRYLNVGGEGQYDRLTQNTISKTLMGLSRGGGVGQNRIDQNRPLPKRQPEGAIDTDPTAQPEQTNFGKTPSTQNLSGSNRVQYGSMNRVPTEEADLDERAQRMFPGISQGQQAEAWKNAELQRQEGNENKLSVAKAGAEGKVGAAQASGQSRVEQENVRQGGNKEVANIRASAYRHASDNKLDAEKIKADQKRAHDGDVDARARLESARKTIATKRMTGETLTKEDIELENALRAGGQQSAQPMSQRQPQASAPQQAPATQKAPAAAGAPPVPGAKFYKGTWYTRGPNGESVPVQQ